VLLKEQSGWLLHEVAVKSTMKTAVLSNGDGTGLGLLQLLEAKSSLRP
jgi:hypothetical protein